MGLAEGANHASFKKTDKSVCLLHIINIRLINGACAGSITGNDITFEALPGRLSQAGQRAPEPDAAKRRRRLLMMSGVTMA
jgi:hypothetical protein